MRMTSRHGLMTFLTFAALGLGVAVHAPAPAAANTPAWPAAVSYFESTPNGTVEKKGNLSAGKTMDLQWAAQSSVACFPATEYDNFRGNHVLYATQIPKYSEMVITVTPDDPKTDVSLYAYEISTTDTTHVAPNLPSCVACEAGYDQKKDSNPGVTEAIKLNSTTHGYNVIIGVAGAQSSDYERVAGQYPNAADRDRAREEIGRLFSSGEHPSTSPNETYGAYYGHTYESFYDQNATPPH